MTSIALIVQDQPGPVREAERYVSALPEGSSLHIHAESAVARQLSALATLRGCSSRRHSRAHDTVRMANIAVIFGDCPFSSDDIAILESQEIAVERMKVSPNRGKPRKRR